jgi:hypothetical protein
MGERDTSTDVVMHLQIPDDANTNHENGRNLIEQGKLLGKLRFSQNCTLHLGSGTTINAQLLHSAKSFSTNESQGPGYLLYYFLLRRLFPLWCSTAGKEKKHLRVRRGGSPAWSGRDMETAAIP